MAQSRYTSWYRVAICLILLGYLPSFTTAAEFTAARVAVSFSPSGGATDAAVHGIAAAQQQILAQAYNFTLAPIAAQN